MQIGPFNAALDVLGYKIASLPRCAQEQQTCSHLATHDADERGRRTRQMYIVVVLCDGGLQHADAMADLLRGTRTALHRARHNDNQRCAASRGAPATQAAADDDNGPGRNQRQGRQQLRPTASRC